MREEEENAEYRTMNKEGVEEIALGI